MGSHVSYHSPTMAGLSTPAPQKGDRMDTSGAARLPIMSKTRNILSAQSILVSIPRRKHSSEKEPFLTPYFCYPSKLAINLEAMQGIPLFFSLDSRDMELTRVKDPSMVHSNLGK